jgi:hypothetical protein
LPTLLAVMFIVSQLQPGTQLAPFTAIGLDGSEFRYDTAATDYVAFYFWSPDDRFCREDLDILNGIQQQRAGPGFKVVTLLAPRQDVERAESMVAERGSGLINTRGTLAIARAFRVNRTPHLVLARPGGLVDTAIIGRIPEDFGTLLPTVAARIEDTLLKASERAKERGDYRTAIRLCDEVVSAFPGDSASLRQALYRKFWCFFQLTEQDSWAATARLILRVFPRADEAFKVRPYILDLDMVEAHRRKLYELLKTKADSLARQTLVADLAVKGTRYSLFARCWLRFLARDNREAGLLKRQFSHDYAGDRLAQELPDIRPMGMRWVGLAGNVVPGVGSAIAGGFATESRTRGWAAFATTATYVAVAALVWDHRSYRSTSFLTPRDRESRDLVLRIEVGASVASYVANLITGFAVGREYDERH